MSHRRAPAARAVALLLCGLMLITGCVNQTVKSTSVPPLRSPAEPVPEAQLLDVAVAIFDPGIDIAAEDDARIYPEVRRAEARYVPQQLAKTLQESGAWGAVRVVPSEDRVADLMLSGTILHSDGETLKLAVTARDARGHLWLQRDYEGTTSRYAYNTGTRRRFDAFQALYHRVANDLLRKFAALTGDEHQHLRRELCESAPVHIPGRMMHQQAHHRRPDQRAAPPDATIQDEVDAQPAQAVQYLRRPEQRRVGGNLRQPHHRRAERVEAQVILIQRNGRVGFEREGQLAARRRQARQQHVMQRIGPGGEGMIADDPQAREQDRAEEGQCGPLQRRERDLLPPVAPHPPDDDAQAEQQARA